MEKILTGAVVLLLTTTAAFAAPDNMVLANQEPTPSSGYFFVGAEGGMGMLDVTQSRNGMVNINVPIVPTQTIVTFASTNQIGSNSFLGGLLLGYNKIFSTDFYLGIVGNALYNSLNTHVYTNQSTTQLNGAQVGSTSVNSTLKNTFQGGAALHLGKKIKNVIPYVLAGVEAGSFKFSNPEFSVANTLVGPQVGAGVMFDLSTHWDAGLEYTFTWFGNLNKNIAGTFSGVNTTGNPVTVTTNINNKINVDQNQILGLIGYQF